MALRLFTRQIGADFVSSGVLADHAAVRAAISTALRDKLVTDCIAEDDSRPILSERWFVVFLGRAGHTG